MTHIGKQIARSKCKALPDSNTRQKLFCLGCLYSLEALSVDRCPECGREFDLSNPKTFGQHGNLRCWLRIRRCVLLSGVAAGLLVGILSVIDWGKFNELWSPLAIVLNGPSMLLAAKASNWVQPVILLVGPIFSYIAYIIAVLYFRKWFVRAAVVIVILVGHIWAANVIINQIMDALGAIL